MILTLDIGNSRIKWANWENNAKIASAAGDYSRECIPEMLRTATETAPERVLVACVGGEDVEHTVSEWFAENLELVPEFLRSGRSARGVTHGYDDPRQHGVDRWAALLGARSLTHAPVCLIDAGTAVTIDWMDADGLHLGGLIMPGLRVLRDALAGAAKGIPASSSRSGNDSCGPHAPVARNTEVAVEDGTLLMLKAALRENMEKARNHLGEDRIVMITGGMAGFMLRLPDMPAMRHEPDLVHLGLLSAFHLAPSEI